MTMVVTRRGFLGGGAALLGGTALSACGMTATSGKQTLTMVTWGGTTGEGYQKLVATPFQKMTGIPVRVTAPVDYGRYRAQQKNDRITWNWIDFEGWYTFQHQEWWANIGNEVVTGDVHDYIELPGGSKPVLPWGIASGSYCFAIAYRTDHPGRHPRSWSEFLDPRAVPGKRSIYNWPFGMLEIALLGDGVPYRDLYPLDIDRAIGKLDSIKGSLTFWNSGAELQQQLSAGTAPFAFAWNNRAAAVARAGKPVALEWQDNLQDGGYDVVAANDPQKDETVRLLRYMNRPDVIVGRSRATGYSPTTHTALRKMSPAERQWLNLEPAHLAKAVGSIDLSWWAKNFDEATDKWNTWASA